MVMSFAYRNGLERSWKKHKPPHNPLIPSHVGWNNLATTALIGTSVGPCCPSFQYFGQDVAYEMRSVALCCVLLRSGRLWRALMAETMRVRYAERWTTVQQRGDRRPWSPTSEIARLHAWVVRCPAALLHCCLPAHQPLLWVLLLPSHHGHPVQCPEAKQERGKVCDNTWMHRTQAWKGLGEEAEL